jgi:hypothetical protein
MSENRDPYLAVTGHYIDVLPNKPQQWELRSEQLVFTPFMGRHTGSNMGDILVCTVDRYGLCRKVAAGDVVGKALALVKQIHKSPQARTFFKKSCAEVEIPFLQLLNWIRM